MVGDYYSAKEVAEILSVSPRTVLNLIRRGVAGQREGVGDVAKEEDLSRTVKAGSKTCFFDIKETKENKPYLLITESRFKGEGEERERVTIAIFPENAQDFLEATSEMIDKII